MTVEEVQEASRRYLAASGLTAVVVGDAEQIAESLRAPWRRSSVDARSDRPGPGRDGAPPRTIAVRSRCWRGSRTTGPTCPARCPTRPAAARSGCSSSTARAPCRCVEGPDGPQLAWDEQPALPAGAVYLGEADGVPYAAVRGERALTVSGRSVDAWAGLRELGADLGDLDAGLLVQAIGILEWHERHRFSPLTGAPTTVERAGWVQRDPTTGTEFFPRTDPAVIMLVHDGGDRLVLGRQAVWPPGRFSILAGFVEPGESAEAAVVREVAEEVGLRVTDVRYVGSQPWPFPQSLMLGLRRPRRGRRRPASRPRRDRGGPLVHPRGAAVRRRARGRCRRRSRSPGTSSTAGWPASSS